MIYIVPCCELPLPGVIFKGVIGRIVAAKPPALAGRHRQDQLEESAEHAAVGDRDDGLGRMPFGDVRECARRSLGALRSALAIGNRIIRIFLKFLSIDGVSLADLVSREALEDAHVPLPQRRLWLDGEVTSARNGLRGAQGASDVAAVNGRDRFSANSIGQSPDLIE